MVHYTRLLNTSSVYSYPKNKSGEVFLKYFMLCEWNWTQRGIIYKPKFHVINE